MKELIEQFQFFLLTLSEEQQKEYKEILKQLINQAQKDGLL